ncbi:hypothetical protein AVEN_176168-1 [Araneus ventricosus]|uniref:Uncharacterized protein n=1 Tax=Araneus ventricosus TaxID=182803 RepID=A0A4Y2RYH5_ARAVE|nr:hypothetical protein AVEN_176168-1 [Araneus ventricosus]
MLKSFVHHVAFTEVHGGLWSWNSSSHADPYGAALKYLGSARVSGYALTPSGRISQSAWIIYRSTRENGQMYHAPAEFTRFFPVDDRE